MPWFQLLRQFFVRNNRRKDSVKNFLKEEKVLYEERFGETAVGIIMQKPLMLLMSVVLLSAALKYYKFTGDLRYPLILIPMMIWAFFHPFATHLFPKRFLFLKLYVLISFYLSANVLMQLWVLPFGKGLVDDAQFVMISLLGIMLASFIATSPYAFRTLIINLPILAVYNTAMGWVAEERGLNILRQNIQGMALGGAISFIMMTIYRYRVYFIVQERMLKERADLISRASEHLSKVFHSIDQAIFYVIEKKEELFIAGEGRSPQCQVILNFPLGQEPLPLTEVFLNKVELDEDQKSSFKNALLAILGSHVIDFEINENHLPRELLFSGSDGQRHLALTYAPLTELDCVKGVLITASDDTILIKARATNAANEARIGRLMSLLSLGREKGEAGLIALEGLTAKTIERFDQLCQTLLKSGDRDPYVNEVFVPLHTIKGNARTLGLKELAALCHEAEGELEFFRKPKSNAESQLGAKLKALEERLQTLQAVVQVYIVEAKLLGWHRHNEVVLMREAYQRALSYESWDYLREAIKEGRDDDGYLEAFLSPGFVRSSRFPALLQHAAQQAATLAQKHCPILEYKGDDVWLRSEVMQRLVAILPHVLANAVDHGIEARDERLEKGKPEQGTITFQMDFHADSISLTITDDGRGVNPDLIANVALSRGLLTSQDVVKLSDSEKVSLILKAGFSSKKLASELSGRGVGMSAIQEEIEGLGGRLQLLLGERQSSGFSKLGFEIVLPACLAWF